MSLIEIKNVKKEYSVRKFGKKYSLMAVNDVSFSIGEGKCVGLVGESGCGKSTLGRLIIGLENTSDGEILFKGESVSTGKGKKIPKSLKFAKNIQMVFQDSFDAVNSKFTAKKIIEEPLKNFTNKNSEEREAEVIRLLNQVGLAKEDKDKYAMEFSGGQLQRVCIARALAANPEVFILDEPLSSLDVSVQAQILNLLSDIKKDMSLSYLLISHDLEAVYYLADEIIVMYGGQIMERIEDISYFDKMLHPYTQKLLSSVPAYEKNISTAESPEVISMETYTQGKEFIGCPYVDRCSKRIDICKDSRPDMKEIEPGHHIACHIL